MATFLFWNIKREEIQDIITTACKEHAVDVLILAECDFDPASLLLRLNSTADPYAPTYLLPFNPSDRLKFVTRYPIDSMEVILDDGGVAIRKVRPPVGREVLLIAVHLPSKLHRTEKEQLLYGTRVAEAIRDAEAAAGHSHSVVIGDFNMDPFEDGMIAAGSLHGVNAKNTALEISREVDGVVQQYFYNPMWSRLGDESDGPPQELITIEVDQFRASGIPLTKFSFGHPCCHPTLDRLLGY